MPETSAPAERPHAPAGRDEANRRWLDCQSCGDPWPCAAAPTRGSYILVSSDYPPDLLAAFFLDLGPEGWKAESYPEGGGGVLVHLPTGTSYGYGVPPSLTAPEVWARQLRAALDAGRDAQEVRTEWVSATTPR